MSLFCEGYDQAGRCCTFVGSCSQISVPSGGPCMVALVLVARKC